jgi:hypothetical protein
MAIVKPVYGRSVPPNMQINKTPIKTTKTGQVVSPVPSNPVSKAIAAKPKPQPKSVSQIQKELKAAGYNVTVDGISGPQTAMARKALANGVDPKYWNKVWLKNHPPAGSPSGGQSGSSSGSSSQSSGSSSTSGTGTTKKATKPTGPAPATPVPTFDPNAYAANAANAEFNPQIADARYNLKYAQKALPESLKDVSGWNQQITDTANRYGGTAGYDQGIQQAAGSQVGGLFGGAYAGEAAAQAAPGMDAMLQNKASQGGFQDIMKSVFAAQGRDYARRATREGNVDITKAQMGLSGLIAGKGQAQAKYLSEGQQRQQDMAISQQALDQARALAEPQLAEAKARADAAAANATTAGIQAKNADKLASLEYKSAKVALDKTIQDNGGKIDLNRPEHVTGLNTSLSQAITGKNGGLSQNPNTAYQTMLRAIAQYPGLIGDKRVVAIMKAALQRALAVSRGRGMYTAWTLDANGMPVLDKKKALANAKARAAK